MTYRGIFEYEYPTKHKPPVSIDVHLHGDCVKGKIIEWEYRPQEQEPTIKIDYRRAFKIACELLNGDVLYGVDTDKIYELMMKKDGVVSSSSYEEYILNHLQELDQGQYASELTTKNDLAVDCIPREQALKCFTICNTKADVWRGIKALPSVTPQEPNTGHWIEHPHESGPNWEYSMYECSECHDWSDNDSDYCPDCGVKMVEPQESEEV